MSEANSSENLTMLLDAKIHDIAVAYVRESGAGRDWPFTVIGTLHPSIAGQLPLEEGELVIVSAFYSAQSWYAFTTRRIISRYEGVIQSLDPTQVVHSDFGNFEGYGPEKGDEELRDVAVVPREVATLTNASGTIVRFEFATWEESSLPMKAIQYWHAKHPFLHKLMTTAEREEFKQRKASQTQTSPPPRKIRPMNRRGTPITLSDEEIMAAITNDEVETLVDLPIKLGFKHESWRFVQEVCVRLSAHPDSRIRANAMQGLYFTAFFHKRLEQDIVQPVLLRGLKDEHPDVAFSAQDSLTNISSLLSWGIGDQQKGGDAALSEP